MSSFWKSEICWAGLVKFTARFSNKWTPTSFWHVTHPSQQDSTENLWCEMHFSMTFPKHNPQHKTEEDNIITTGRTSQALQSNCFVTSFHLQLLQLALFVVSHDPSVFLSLRSGSSGVQLCCGQIGDGDAKVLDAQQFHRRLRRLRLGGLGGLRGQGDRVRWRVGEPGLDI